MTDRNPVFVCGCDRSGTTMLASMLGRHENIAVIPEAQFLVKLLDRFGADNPIRKDQAEAALARNFRFSLWDLHEVPSFDGGQKTVPEFMRLLVCAFVADSGYRLWVDHTPWSISYVERLLGAFPRAKFVNMIRDGRAVASSIPGLPDWPIANALPRCGIGELRPAWPQKESTLTRS